MRATSVVPVSACCVSYIASISASAVARSSQSETSLCICSGAAQTVPQSHLSASLRRLTGACTGKCEACTAYAAAERCNRNVSALHCICICIALHRPTHALRLGRRLVVCFAQQLDLPHSMAWQHGTQRAAHPYSTQQQARQRQYCCRTNYWPVLCCAVLCRSTAHCTRRQFCRSIPSR
jgi:hypothetical protein